MIERKRGSDRCGRKKLSPPGCPKAARREDQAKFWRLIAQGLSSEDAATGIGASPAVGGRWFREAGEMPPSQYSASAPSLSRRYLSFAEREEIALHRASGLSPSHACKHALPGQRMSGKGNCYDNSAVEAFFKTIKAELIWRRPWPTRRATDGHLRVHLWLLLSSPTALSTELGKPGRIRTESGLNEHLERH